MLRAADCDGNIGVGQGLVDALGQRSRRRG